MDASPLTLVGTDFASCWDIYLFLHRQAQTHARKASKANTPSAAIDEHDLAAGQFATAAKGTENSEVQDPQYYRHSLRLIYG